ncbi:MAG: hypothetical protein A2Y03_03025 [Omnitrophica WOR_2 bacterium GWF2_38_59]|nr:MAG: hypothetical protein A2Y03_03025 [Omnitrophica WOR_2 bacterium GWF2_38_59]
MSAFVIIDMDVKDQEQYAKYMKQGGPTIIAHDGEPLVRGEKIEVWEGNWQPKRMIVIKFKTVEAARDWWNSSDYKEAKKLRAKAALAKIICIEGI